MTTPGGVPNLPTGALTLDTLAADTQDMSGTAMKARAVERFPSIFNASTGLDPSLDITPFGILTRIWAEVNSLIANADPADVQGPDDIPELVLEFIEGLPFVGQFVELLEAILGNYGGTDTTLLSIQSIFAPINAIVAGLTAAGIDPSNLGTALTQITDAFQGIDLTGDPGAILTKLDDIVFATGDEAPQYPPYTPPYTPSSTRQTTDFFALLRRFLAWGDITGSGFNFDTAVQNTIGTLLGQNLLAGLTNGQIDSSVLPTGLLDMLKQIITLGLPSATIPTNPADIITLAMSAWNSWWSIITGTQQQATAAATQAASNTAAINQQVTGGTSIVDTEFNTAETANINASYTTLYQGAGGGSMFADGIGNIIWKPSGGIARTGYFLPPGILSTDNFDVQLILDPDIAIPPPFNGSQCYIWILARGNSALTEFTAVRIGYNTVVFGDAHASSGGNWVVRSTSFPIVSGPGDSFVLRGGYTASAWELKLLQNNMTVADYTDSGHNATIGSGFRRVGGGMTAADQNGSQSQLVPPKITSITASDRLASAA